MYIDFVIIAEWMYIDSIIMYLGWIDGMEENENGMERNDKFLV